MSSRSYRVEKQTHCITRLCRHINKPQSHRPLSVLLPDIINGLPPGGLLWGGFPTEADIIPGDTQLPRPRPGFPTGSLLRGVMGCRVRERQGGVRSPRAPACARRLSAQQACSAQRGPLLPPGKDPLKQTGTATDVTAGAARTPARRTTPGKGSACSSRVVSPTRPSVTYGSPARALRLTSGTQMFRDLGRGNRGLYVSGTTTQLCSRSRKSGRDDVG